MYQPPQFRSDDSAIAADLMRAHQVASLISTDDGGFPFVTHLPLHLEEGNGAAWARSSRTRCWPALDRLGMGEH